MIGGLVLTRELAADERLIAEEREEPGRHTHAPERFGPLAAELQEHVKHKTAPYKYPREIEFLPELPKTISGKIRRVELRDREAERHGTGADATHRASPLEFWEADLHPLRDQGNQA